MKKGDEIRQKFNARVVVLIEKDGVFYGYLSHDDLSIQLPPIAQHNLSTPNDFITVAQQQRRPMSEAPGTMTFGTPEPVGAKASEPKFLDLKPQTPPPSSVKSSESRQLRRDYFTGPSFNEEGSEMLDYFV